MATYIVPAYIFSISNVDSTIGSNNIIATWNPLNSGRVFIPSAVTINYEATSAGDVDPVRAYRISQQPTGGTLAYNPAAPDQSVVCKLDTSFPDSVAYLYTGNPSVGTLGAPFLTIPSGLTQETSSDRVVFADVHGAQLLVRPGQGIVIRQNLGKPGMFWNISFSWGSRGE